MYSGPLQIPANQAPGVQIGHAQGVICLYIAKELSKIFFSEIMRPWANSLSLKQEK